MASEDSTRFEICDPDGLVMDTIKVQVIFAGINKDNLNMTGKVLKKENLKMPITRLGSWVFHTTENSDEIETLISTGGPIAAFLFALHKSYPQLTVWVDNPENGSFVIDVEKKEKAKILKEVAGNMKPSVQKYLSEIENVDLNIKIIKIVRDKPATLKTENPISNTDEMTECQATTSTAETNEHRLQDVANDWKYVKLKAKLKSSSEKKESRLKTLLEFAICSCNIEKYDKVRSAISEIKNISSNVKLQEQELISVLQDIKTLQQLLFSSSKFTESVEIVFVSAELLMKLEKQEQKIELMNLFSTNVCGSLAKVFKVKPSCFDCNIRAEDEIEGSTAYVEGAGTKWDQANKAHQSGKLAFTKFDFADALRFYDLAITLQPHEITYYLDKAEVFLATNEYEKSEEECKKALELEGNAVNKARGFALLGEAEFRMYRLLMAIGHFSESLKLHFTQNAEDKRQKLCENVKAAHQLLNIREIAGMMQIFSTFEDSPEDEFWENDYVDSSEDDLF